MSISNKNDYHQNNGVKVGKNTEIRGHVYHTPTTKNDALSEITGTDLWLKHEYKQFTGSFKERGARNALEKLTGNHALALSYHGGLMGIPVTVIMPTIAPLTKIERCKKLGARVVLHGMHIGEVGNEMIDTFHGADFLFDDPPICAGAGTIGLEILEQVPDVDVIVVPVGGAGLIAGIAMAVKTLRPEVQIIGVEPEKAASYTKALEVGEPTPVTITNTLADGLAVPTVGPHSFAVARHFVDKTVLINEKLVALAVLRLLEHERAVVEGGGAAGLAALLPGGPLDVPQMKGKKVVVPLCGGNIDITMLGRVIERGLAADRRLVRFAATVSDRPGGLAALTQIIFSAGASVWDIAHERAWLHTSVDQVVNKVVVEVSGHEHEMRLKATLEKAG
ncbi:hypothetical protein GUITHDRAFT_157602 [Guillardia theta CCMP2712]|uniref:Tryptophan synthase beta chain-like PALP domain-containing protein n=1 Tax=Guillardia theta (strain CCMP2712) TaxID=905079 RepID=L1JHI6_GUITC|nr:hypothetical protein GUITHDRAFT_157602 [Guillardia theta CCMP2712]EKX47609.1 hypothetical protein GUITHDRAFT_157602 [Guillardia theta CCMP2712]|eukprot:XP_005834589.1 hypothetical protein GUITHDRAFT_157602 [Guillardia theta CCMP2712]